MHVNISTLAVAAALFATPLVSALSADSIPSDLPVSELLSSAQSHLSKGETSDALLYYDAAVARDPSNYLTFFKRATTYLSLGRTSQATEDYNRVLSLKPDFEGAHIQLAKIRARSADWEGAKEHYKLANKDAASPELAALDEAQGAAQLAEAAERAGDFETCVHQAGEAIMTANRAVYLRELRSRCHEARRYAPHVTISANTFYGLDDLNNGMAQIRKCLHSDPDSKPCKKMLKQQKVIDKTLAKVTKAFEKNQPMTGVKMLIDNGEDAGLITNIKSQVEELKQDGTIPANAPSALYMRVVDLACEGYYEMNSKKTKQYCDNALALNEQSFYGLLHRAREQMDKEEFEDAVRTLEEAKNVKPEKQNIGPGGGGSQFKFHFGGGGGGFPF
ncbi:DnaJ subfamily C member 3 like protein [Verticillium longisporum]|uniref:DnaJ subfamily C member 3 like protein n=1 Tax=Verticillium longisporum TaxID=100787 RepID=A0A8I2Z0Q1_VERLO|nr:DnaJ subfamily C member 3 like protein [Verticillium longisporum]